MIAPGTEIICIAEHPDCDFTVDNTYKVCAQRKMGRLMGVRIRDDKRQRKDFNFIPHSKNYFYKHFKLKED